MIDRFTRWPEAVPIPDISADTVTTAFYTNWVARFREPAVIITNRGSQFESQLFQALTKLIGSKRTRTTAYHPVSNGMIERWHRSLKTAIMCHNTSNWTDVLPTVLLGLRTSYKEDIKSNSSWTHIRPNSSIIRWVLLWWRTTQGSSNICRKVPRAHEEH